MKRPAILLVTVSLLSSLSSGEPQQKRSGHPDYTDPDIKIGDVAPDFELVQLDESGSNQMRRVRLCFRNGQRSRPNACAAWD